jgi:CIC family chloride channel protein
VIRPVVALIKSLASALSIGSGASVGREGPIVQIGSAFGSTVAGLLKLPTWQRLTLIAAGAGGGIAATFNTPVGGVLFAIELLLHEISVRTVLPVTIATVTAAYFGRVFFGAHPAFVIPASQKPDFVVTNPEVLLAFLLLGALLGVASAIYIQSIYAFEDFFERVVPRSYYLRHGLGMLVSGALMYALFIFTGAYHVEGVGYATVQQILTGSLQVGSFLFLLFLLKILATSLALGSGASGGIFSPGLFVGATLGGAFGAFLHQLLPGLPINTAEFAVAGMAGLVGGATGAAVTAIVMIMEMTFDYSVVIPLTFTVAMSYGVRRFLTRQSIYTLKLARRGHYIPEALYSGGTRAEAGERHHGQELRRAASWGGPVG